MCTLEIEVVGKEKRNHLATPAANRGHALAQPIAVANQDAAAKDVK